MDDRVNCKECQAMPKIGIDDEYHTKFGRCATGEVWWHPEQKLRCALFQPVQEIFWV